MRWPHLFLVAVCASLAACAAGPGSQPPQAPLPPPLDEPSTAVVSLLDSARTARANGDLDGAAASIERALRIERRSPRLYLELARVRLAQGEFRQAEALSLKAAALAPTRQTLQAEAWALIAQARQASGDSTGALEARHKAGEFPNP